MPLRESLNNRCSSRPKLMSASQLRRPESSRPRRQRYLAPELADEHNTSSSPAKELLVQQAIERAPRWCAGAMRIPKLSTSRATTPTLVALRTRCKHGHAGGLVAIVRRPCGCEWDRGRRRSGLSDARVVWPGPIVIPGLNLVTSLRDGASRVRAPELRTAHLRMTKDLQGVVQPGLGERRASLSLASRHSGVCARRSNRRGSRLMAHSKVQAAAAHCADRTLRASKILAWGRLDRQARSGTARCRSSPARSSRDSVRAISARGKTRSAKRPNGSPSTGFVRIPATRNSSEPRSCPEVYLYGLQTRESSNVMHGLSVSGPRGMRFRRGRGG